jgi:8-oxo-dGTP pyrophosphatase MutT (NUDIX family)
MVRLGKAGAMTNAGQLRQLGDELRALAQSGIHWSEDEPYHRHRYERVRHVAAAVFAIADERGVEEIERTVFSQLTHVAPLPCGDAAIVDDDQRILLIQRADDRLWAMPGGGFEVGETPAAGVAREAFEETGVLVDVVELVGVWDSRFCETRSSLQLFQFVFLCRPLAQSAATTPHEVLDQRWFSAHELPPLSPGHTVRVPAVFAYLADRRARFDRPARDAE